jgi:hypothetical protein
MLVSVAWRKNPAILPDQGENLPHLLYCRHRPSYDPSDPLKLAYLLS